MKRCAFLLVLMAAATSVAVANDRGAMPAAQTRLAELAAKMPLRFEENVGQVKEMKVRYFARGRGYRLFLGAEDMVFSLDGETSAEQIVRLRLKGGAERPALVGIDPLTTKTHYLRGNDPRAWHTGIANFAGVRYESVYPGTDVVFSGNERRVEQSFFLAAGAEPQRIRLAYEGITGMEIGTGGELILRTEGDDLTAARPIAYQIVDGERWMVECRYELLASAAEASEVGFALGDYDRELPLVIDPTFSNSTFLGGSDGDIGSSVGVDAAGNVYVAGNTFSVDFPGTISPGGIQPANAGSSDGFVAKIDPTGTTLLYSTYLGGSDLDSIVGTAVDAAGNVYITGFTNSTNFPGVTGGSLQSSNAGGGDVFVAKLNPAGSALVYATYLGGSGNDVGYKIAFDVSANAYVSGHTASTDFPGVTAGSLQATNAGNFDGFVAKIDATASAILYATYLGGSGQDVASSIAVDPAGNAVIAGDTASSGFPGVTGSSLKSSLTGPRDGFVTKLSPTGGAFVYSTYLGGSDDDTATRVAVDATGNAYLVGFTSSTDFTGVTAGSIQPDNPGGYAAFVTKIDAAGTAAVYSTYLGGDFTLGQGIALDSATNVYVTGRAGNDFPIVNAIALQPEPAGHTDGFVAKINAAGDALMFSTYFGGDDFDSGLAIAVDGAQDIAYVTGQTSSMGGLPGITPSSIQQTNGGSFSDDAFLLRIVPTALLTIEKEADVEIIDPGNRITYTLTYENIGELPAMGATLTETVPEDTVFRPTFSSPGWSCTPDDQAGSECTLNLGTVAAGASGSATFAVRVKNNVSAEGDVIENTACAHPGDQCADAETPTTAAPILLMTKTALFNVARPGNVLDYRLKAFNTGNMDAEPVIVTDTVPPLAVFNPTVSTPGWDCEPDGSAGSECTFEVGTLEANKHATIIFAVTLSTQYSNTACVEVVAASPERLPRNSISLKDVPAPSCATATTPLD